MGEGTRGEGAGRERRAGVGQKRSQFEGKKRAGLIMMVEGIADARGPGAWAGHEQGSGAGRDHRDLSNGRHPRFLPTDSPGCPRLNPRPGPWPYPFALRGSAEIARIAARFSPNLSHGREQFDPGR